MGERKLTKSRRRVLESLVRLGGKAHPHNLAWPRSNMMHTLFMSGLVTIEGQTNPWGEPGIDGFYCITDAGRSALEASNG